MQGKTIGIGMVGCGGMGRSLTRRVVEGRDDIRVTGLYDPDSRSIEAARGSIAPDAQVYDSYEALVADDRVDWVMIASWNCAHKDQTIAAFNAGKHVFCQKPLALSLDDCLEMYDAWQASGRMFTIGFTLRYSPHYRTLHRLLREGVVGDIISMEFNECIGFNHGGYIMGDWRRLRKYAGTHLLEKCCHDIDLVNWFVGSRASRVASFGGLDFFVPRNEHHVQRLGTDKNGRPAYSTWRCLVGENPFTGDKDIIDNQVAIIEYENGVRATFHTNCHSAIPERRMYICGTEGAVRADIIAGSIEICRIGFDEQIERIDAGAKGGHGGGDQILASDLIDSMLNNAPPAVSLDAGLASALTCFAIDDALDNGRIVDAGPMWERVDEVMAGETAKV